MATDAEAKAALYDAVVDLAGKATRVSQSQSAARLLVAASVAYRAAEGGAQVGNITVSE